MDTEEVSEVHVLEVLNEVTKLSSDKLDHYLREKKENILQISLQKENIKIGGKECVIRRVYARVSSALQYSTVGWVMDQDVDNCMTCSKEFWFFHSRIHCHACGNINCADCAESFCLVEELPDMDRGVPVCTQCYWGQDVVSCFHRKGVDDIFQAATSRWTDSNLQHHTNHSHSNLHPQFVDQNFSDDESEDSFHNGNDEERNYDSDSTSDTVIEARLREEQRIKDEEAAAELQLYEAEQARKEERLAEQKKRSKEKNHSVQFGKEDISISDIEYVPANSDAQLPEPLFVMKTTRHRSTKKVYINVCTLSDIDMVLEFGCSTGIYINGSGLESTDKYTGDPITIFDVLVNTCPGSTVCFDKDNTHDWVDEVCLHIVELINVECYENLDTSMPSIPNKKYKGSDIKAFDVKAASTKFHMENTRRLHEATALMAQQAEREKREHDEQIAKEKLEREKQEIISQQLRSANEDRIERETREREEIEKAAARLAKEKREEESLHWEQEQQLKQEKEAQAQKERELQNHSAQEQEQEQEREQNRLLKFQSEISSGKSKATDAGSILPSPLCVIKTKRIHTSDKVFINISSINSPKLLSGNGTSETHNGLHMNGTVPVESVAKSGESCYIFDVVVNTASPLNSFDIGAVDIWKETVGAHIIDLVNSECNEQLDSMIKFPKIKGNYKGSDVKLFDLESLEHDTPSPDTTDHVTPLHNHTTEKSKEDEIKLVSTSEMDTVGDLRRRYSMSREHHHHQDAVEKTAISNINNEYITEDDLDYLSMQTITPLFVIKTKRASTSEKVFINICALTDVDLVSALSAKRGILLNGKNPVSSVDKSGETCYTYDVFVNTVASSEKFYDLDATDVWREEVGQMLIDLINKECHESLDVNIKFPKIKGNYKGEKVKPFTSSEEEHFSKPPAARVSVVAHQLQRGWMKKQSRGGFIKNWKNRYFVLTGGEIQYYEDEKPTAPYGTSLKGSMELIGAEIEDKGGLQFCVVVKTGHEKDMLVEAENMASKEAWMRAIKNHIEEA